MDSGRGGKRRAGAGRAHTTTHGHGQGSAKPRWLAAPCKYNKGRGGVGSMGRGEVVDCDTRHKAAPSGTASEIIHVSAVRARVRATA